MAAVKVAARAELQAEVEAGAAEVAQAWAARLPAPVCSE
jgi:hypothetical protein